VLPPRISTLDELQTETETDDRLVTEQRYQQRKDAGHGALQTEGDAFEQVVKRQSQDEYHGSHGTRTSCVVACCYGAVFSAVAAFSFTLGVRLSGRVGADDGR